jgi:hypothetical protein
LFCKPQETVIQTFLIIIDNRRDNQGTEISHYSRQRALLLRDYNAAYACGTDPERIDQHDRNEPFLHRFDGKVCIYKDLRLECKTAEYVIVHTHPENKEPELLIGVYVEKKYEQSDIYSRTDDDRYPFIGDADMVFINASRT